AANKPPKTLRIRSPALVARCEATRKGDRPGAKSTEHRRRKGRRDAGQTRRARASALDTVAATQTSPAEIPGAGRWAVGGRYRSCAPGAKRPGVAGLQAPRSP